MAGRPKVQFNDKDGAEAWKLLDAIKSHWDKERQVEFEKELEKFKDEWPEANIQGTCSSYSAGEIVLSLLRDEADRLKIKRQS